ncbi:HAMP domain-containing histidine kinase [Brevibacillus brevis]|uniref:histidine kinase n=2 Tax=Brevibacillus brevis TaxID=1393 RepID=A0A517I2Q7_BREBE|nr:HAMP domain-containing histidine kinase [Brevibacillus brevis]
MKLLRKLVLHYLLIFITVFLVSQAVYISSYYLHVYIDFWVLFFGTFLLIALLYSIKMSAPIFYFLKWLDLLSQGIYEEPKLSPRKKRSFRLYKELIVKMQQLTSRLRQNEMERKELEAMRREWTSGVTHDLKTPLSYIQGYSTMLLSEDHHWTEEERKTFLTIMQEKALHMQQLINDLNESFQFENGAVQLDKKQTDIIPFLRELVDDAQYQPSVGKSLLHFQSDQETLVYRYDEHVLRRALTNFLMNAVIHNPAGTEITLSVQCDTELTITITDNGIGMTAEEQKKLFERYYRGTSTDTPIGGTGLGMAIAKQLIVAHRGTIQVQSSPGKGTTINISLPLE